MIPTPTPTLSQYQKSVDDNVFYAHANQRDAGEFAYILQGVAGEAGELLEVHKKIVRDAGFLDKKAFHLGLLADGNILKLIHEAGDVLWYITRMCSVLDITLGELQLFNIVKLYERHGDEKWPLKVIPYEDALKLIQHIESRITQASASICMDTDT